MIARLKPLLEDPSVLKIAQNAKYDIAVLSRYGIEVGPIEDTMLISYVLEAGLHKSHGMDELSKRWLAHEPIKFASVTGSGKAQKSFKHVPLDPATCYAAEDADVTLRLYQHLRPRLVAEGLLTVYETLERGMPPVLAMMENNGIKVDPDQLRKLSYDFSNRMGELEAEAHKLAGRPFNLGSPKQVGELLFQEMGLASGRMTATGAAATTTYRYRVVRPQVYAATMAGSSFKTEMVGATREYEYRVDGDHLRTVTVPPPKVSVAAATASRVETQATRVECP